MTLLALGFRVVYLQGYKRGAREIARDSRWVEGHLTRWIRINDKFVSDVSRAALEDEASTKARNVRLIYENRHLRKKVVRLAYRYGRAYKLLKARPKKDTVLDTMSQVLDTMRYIEAMGKDR